MSDTLEQRGPDASESASPEDEGGIGPTRIVQRARSTAPPPPPAPPPPKRKKRRAVFRTLRSIVAAALAVGTGALAATIWRSTVAANAPTPTPVVRLETAARGRTSMTRLTVTATPANARIVVDGVTLTPGRAHEAPRDGAFHQVQVDAAGHVSQTVMVQFDREVVPLHIALAHQAEAPSAEPARAEAGKAVRPARSDAKPQASKSGSWVREVGLDSPDPWQK